MDTIKTINAVLTALFFLCYAYQFFYIPAAMLPRKRKKTPPSGRRYAVLIFCFARKTFLRRQSKRFPKGSNP